MNKWLESGDLLNIASSVSKTRALGPGSRNAVWFQGCPFHCTGCISPEWILQQEASLVKPEDLAEIMTIDDSIQGVTISGGEPFLQPIGLNRLLRQVHTKHPEMTIILFSGYVLEQLLKFSEKKRVQETLSYIDILVDGQFQEKLNDNQGLRGSTNQRIHRFSNRFDGINFESMTRINEIRLEQGFLQIAGVPDISLSHFVLNSLNGYKVSSYVRP
jgi:anaerobic ribonucleoside-triphosphate reductase activating protein